MLLSPVSGDIAQGASTQLTKRPVAFRHNDFLTSERWCKGPAFLKKPEEDWPCFEIEALPEDEQELKGERAIFTLTLADLPAKLHELLVKYSSWTVLQQKVACETAISVKASWIFNNNTTNQIRMKIYCSRRAWYLK